jgi:uncharacterized protein with HEPN domain
MSKHRDDIVLSDIMNAAKLIDGFVQGFDKEGFIVDWKTRSAVMYQLTVIGEAVKRLSPEFRLAHAEIPWSSMAGMRDHLIHAYDLVDWDEVWATATRDVPELLKQLEHLSDNEL